MHHEMQKIEQCWQLKWQRKSIWILIIVCITAFWQVDPLFKVMSAAFDEGGSSGLLLNNLRCFDDRQDLVLDSSSDVAQVDYSIDVSQRKPLEMSEIKGRLLFKIDLWYHCNCTVIFYYPDLLLHMIFSIVWKRQNFYAYNIIVGMFRGIDLNSKEVCPSFSSFEFSNWDSSMEVWPSTYTDHDRNKHSVCILNIILTEKW